MVTFKESKEIVLNNMNAQKETHAVFSVNIVDEQLTADIILDTLNQMIQEHEGNIIDPEHEINPNLEFHEFITVLNQLDYRVKFNVTSTRAPHPRARLHGPFVITHTIQPESSVLALHTLANAIMRDSEFKKHQTTKPAIVANRDIRNRFTMSFDQFVSFAQINGLSIQMSIVPIPMGSTVNKSSDVYREAKQNVNDHYARMVQGETVPPKEMFLNVVNAYGIPHSLIFPSVDDDMNVTGSHYMKNLTDLLTELHLIIAETSNKIREESTEERVRMLIQNLIAERYQVTPEDERYEAIFNIIKFQYDTTPAPEFEFPPFGKTPFFPLVKLSDIQDNANTPTPQVPVTSEMQSQPSIIESPTPDKPQYLSMENVLYPFSLERDIWQDPFIAGMKLLGFDSYGDTIDDRYTKKGFYRDYEGINGYYENEVFMVRPYADLDEPYDLMPNFIYKPLNLQIIWYKYMLRAGASNQPITPEQFVDILAECRLSIAHLM